MYQACMAHLDYDVAVMAAAVADFTPQEPAPQKIKKGAGGFNLDVEKNSRYFSHIRVHRRKRHRYWPALPWKPKMKQENALKKLEKKGADLMVLNSLNDAGAGFGKNTNRVTLLKEDGVFKTFETKQKTEVAQDIVAALIEMIP
jgi:phosphopantothenoylcysteine decarboxylase/phosphopantothenate--cysteine ligase